MYCVIYFSLSLSFSPEVLKRKAIDIVLLPLQCVSAQTQDTGITQSLNCAFYIVKTLQLYLQKSSYLQQKRWI